MRISWFFAGVIAGTAFFISAVIAGFAGVPFGVLLLRAAISGVLFAAASIGAELLLQQQLPELYAAIRGEQEPGSPSAAEGAESGEGVDIVLESEEGQEEAEFGAETLAEGEEEAEAVPPSASDQLVEEVAEATADGDEEASETAGQPKEAATETEESRSVDSLPDIGEFSETFESGDSGSSSKSGNQSGSGQYSSSGESSGEGPRGSGSEDPAAIARAIQTVLKRDE
jgi:uncharacterized membrane protein YgcG